MKILFVCHGNINRSAAGEIILKKLKPDWEVKSAALKDTKGGEITAKKMREALKEFGYQTDGIRSTPISEELIQWADVVFYMDNSNEKKLNERFSNYSSKFKRISKLVNIDKVPDPNFSPGTEMHKQVIKILEKSLEIFINEH